MSNAQAAETAADMGAVDPTAAAPAARASTQPVGIWHPSQKQMFDHRRKSPFVAAVLSIFPGVGQLYIGYYVRGFVIAAIFLFVVALSAGSREPLGPVLGMMAMFLWVFNIIDAGRMAALYNHAAAGADIVELPEDFKLPKMGGSIVGGGLLLLFGAIALSNTLFGFSLDWLEDWWPIFPFILGAYLFVRGVMDYTAEPSDRGTPSATSEHRSGVGNETSDSDIGV